MWTNFIYRFPEDDLATLFQVLGELPERVHLDIDWTVSRDLLVAVADPVAAMCLRMAVGSERPHDANGHSLLTENEVLVPSEHRDECVRLLDENYRSKATWLVPIRVSMRGSKAPHLFAEAYCQIVPRLLGCPANLCRGDAILPRSKSPTAFGRTPR